jgi:hypothetical protein
MGFESRPLGKTREASFAERHKEITEQHDRDKERNRMCASATVAQTTDRPIFRKCSDVFLCVGDQQETLFI